MSEIEGNQPEQSTNRGGRRVKSEYQPRQMEALKLLTAGYTFDEIAELLGYADRSGAYQAVMATLRRQTMQDAESVRSLELRRTEELLQAIWPIATYVPPAIDEELGGDEFDVDDAKRAAARAQHQLQAAQTVLKVLDRRAKYLGLDAPSKIETEIKGTTDEEWRETIQGLYGEWKKTVDKAKAEEPEEEETDE